VRAPPPQIHLYLTNHMSPYHQIAHTDSHYLVDNDAAQNRGVVCRCRRSAPSPPHTHFSPLPTHERLIRIPIDCISGPSSLDRQRRCMKLRRRSSFSSSGPPFSPSPPPIPSTFHSEVWLISTALDTHPIDAAPYLTCHTEPPRPVSYTRVEPSHFRVDYVSSALNSTPPLRCSLWSLKHCLLVLYHPW
jgi:hypothetical protein